VPLSLQATFLIAAGLMLAGAATITVWPLHDTSGLDRSSVVFWPEPSLAIDVDPQDGPVLVQSAYEVAVEDEAAFLRAMAHQRRARLRTGAIRWNLYRDLETPRRFVEQFEVPSWEEHLLQHGGRYTGSDRDVEERVSALAQRPPESDHLVAVDVLDDMG
jgi:hypothetical protein